MQENADIWQRLQDGVITDDPAATQALAAEFAAALPENRYLALTGDLGAGKTTFVKGLARAWNIRSAVTSPTYNIYTLYDGTRQLVHVDAYRLGSADDMESLMLEEFLREPWCIAVEWPGNIDGWFPAEHTLWLEFDHTSDRRHQIKLRPQRR